MKINFTKNADGLVPAVVQDNVTQKVLMLGYMNREAVDKTVSTGKVTFYSRTKKRLWTKGESSGNFIKLVELKTDCDNDTILVKGIPTGPVCHTGADTCFDEKNSGDFLDDLEKIIEERKKYPTEKSYTSSLFNKGVNAIAQKVGEEAVELVIEAKDNDDNKFNNEAADLLFHYLILLNQKGSNLKKIKDILEVRHGEKHG